METKVFRLVHPGERIAPLGGDEIPCLELDEFQFVGALKWARDTLAGPHEKLNWTGLLGSPPVGVVLTRPGKMPPLGEQSELNRAGMRILEVPEHYWSTSPPARPAVLVELYFNKLRYSLETLGLPKIDREHPEFLREMAIFGNPPVQLDEKGRTEILRRINRRSEEVD